MDQSGDSGIEQPLAPQWSRARAVCLWAQHAHPTSVLYEDESVLSAQSYAAVRPLARRAELVRAAAVQGFDSLDCIEGINEVQRRRPRYAVPSHTVSAH